MQEAGFFIECGIELPTRASRTQAHRLTLTGVSLFTLGSITVGADATVCQRAITDHDL
jgi:hypothetical protein